MCGQAVAGWLVPTFVCLAYGVIGSLARRHNKPPARGATQSEQPGWERRTDIQLRIFRFLRYPLLMASVVFGVAAVLTLVGC